MLNAAEALGIDEEHERDRPLTFHWRTLDAGLIQALDISWCHEKDYNAARNSILTEAVLAHDEGRWVSYSRRRQFYAGLRRYHGTAYTFATVLPAGCEFIRQPGAILAPLGLPGR